jgi:hypothetical protein
MPAYNFQSQFVPKILDRSKPHTIRKCRKRPTRVGDRLYLYEGLRTKAARMIAISECVKVERIVIYLSDYHKVMRVLGDDMISMTASEVESLALADGFDSTDDFFQFFKRYKAKVLIGFEIIHWDVGELFMPVNHASGTMNLPFGSLHRAGRS